MLNPWTAKGCALVSTPALFSPAGPPQASTSPASKVRGPGKMSSMPSSSAAFLWQSTAPSSDAAVAVKGDLEKLESLCRMIQASIRDAEKLEVVDELKRHYLEELRDVHLDAEDVLDEWRYELFRAEAEGETHKRKRAGASDPSVRILADDAALRDRMAHQISAVVKRFDQIAYQSSALRSMVEGRVSSRVTRSRPPSSSVVDERYVCGMGDEKGALVESVLSGGGGGSSNLTVIPVVGAALAGKTTLVQLAYNDPRVVRHFDLRGWVCLTGNSDLMNLLQSVVESLTPDPRCCAQLDTIHRLLQRLVTGKRFLLVLDDFCDENLHLWSAVKASLCCGSHGSVVLVTTQSGEVARVTQTGVPRPFYLYGKISDDQCWLLFERHAFDDGARGAVAGRDMGMEALREKVVEICQGMASLAKLLGVSFRYRHREEEWTDFMENVVEDEILPALQSVFHGLPGYLKPCLLYCSLFPKGYLFNRDQLVRLWVAQGLILSKNRRRLEEDIGIRYFGELLQGSFLLQTETDAELYYMPNHIRDLVCSMSRSQHCRVEDIHHNLPPKARHVSLTWGSEMPCEQFYAYGGLRSFMVMAPSRPSRMHLQIPDEMFHRLNRLRSLDLSYTNIRKLPDSVGNLKHLRFLALNGTEIRSLPESIGMLYNLQTLELKKCFWLQKLPRGISSLINLRHLDVDSDHPPAWMPLQFQRLTSLQKLPTLNLHAVNATLNLHAGNTSRQMRDLQGLRNLRVLDISGLCNLSNLDDAKAAEVRNKIYLKALRLMWTSNDAALVNSEQLRDLPLLKFSYFSDETSDEENEFYTPKKARGSVVEQYSDHEKPCSFDVDNEPGWCRTDIPDEQESNRGSLQSRDQIVHMDNCVSSGAAVSEEDHLASLCPSTNVEKLSIKDYGGAKFPDWIGDPSFYRLADVKFMGCRCVVLPPLGQLPYLKLLSIDGMPVKQVGTEFCGTGNANAFPNLEKLYFHNMNKWTKWDGLKEGDLCNLNKLSLFNCPQLRSIPNYFSSLEVLEVERCTALSDVPSLPSLQVLSLQFCDGLTALPTLTPLHSLSILNCQKLRSLPLLPLLENLWIEDCEQLTSVDACICRPSGLKSLLIANCCHLSLSPVGPLATHIQSFTEDGYLVIGKWRRTHEVDEQ